MSSSRSILFLNHNFRGRGTFFRNFHLARALAQIGWEATLMTMSPTHTATTRITVQRRVQIIETPFLLANQRLGASGCCMWDCVVRGAKVATRRFDAVFVSDHLPNVSIPFLAAKLIHADTVFIADWADLFTEGGLHEGLNSRMWKPAYLASRWLEFGTKRWAELCTATSRPLLRLLHERISKPPERTLYLPSGCDVQIPFPESCDRARAILGLPPDTVMVGRTSSGDHIFEVEMKAMRALAERFRELTQRDLVFYLIGPCDPSRYPELFRHCRIRATGRLTPEEMPLHLGACDFFLLMEENVPKCQYRGPIRVNDYMAAGRPVLCNSVGDHVQTLLNARACVVCDDLRVENEAVDRLLTVPEERIHLGRRARELAEGDLSWERLGAKLDQFLRSALA